MKQLLKSEYVIFIKKKDSYQWRTQWGQRMCPPPPLKQHFKRCDKAKKEDKI